MGLRPLIVLGPSDSEHLYMYKDGQTSDSDALRRHSTEIITIFIIAVDPEHRLGTEYSNDIYLQWIDI